MPKTLKERAFRTLAALSLVPILAVSMLLYESHKRHRYETDPVYRAQVDADRAAEKVERELRAMREAASAAKEAARKAALEREGNSQDAHQMAQKFVRGQLKTPATADFCNWLLAGHSPGISTERIAEATYRCQGYVDAQNLFGALVRSNYDVVVQYRGGDIWHLVSCEIR